MRKTTLFLIGLAFALMVAACGSSDSETLSATGGNGDQVVETPANPAPDDGVGEAPATPTSTDEAAEGGQTAEDDQASATPEPDDQIVEGPANPDPNDEAGESGTSSSSEADEDDRTSTDASSASSSEDQTEDGPEDDTDAGAGASSGAPSTSEDNTDGTPSPDLAVSVSSDQVNETTPTPSPTPVVPESDRRPVTVEDVQIVVRESWPMQVAVMISGALPTPCHELKWTVEQSATTTSDGWTVAADGSVHTISVWTTELPSDMACATVMEPFSEQVELGRFVSGDYTIVVNGERFPVTL